MHRRAQDCAPLLAVVTLALVVRVPLALQPACIDRNGVQFVQFARWLGDEPVRAMRETRRQPGLAALLLGTHAAIGRWLGGDMPESWQRCGELLALTGGVGACAGVFVLTRRLFDARVALLAGVLAAAWPQGAEMSAQVLSDMPHLALYLAALLLADGAIRSGSAGRMALAGIVAGLSYLVRQEAIGLVAAAGICRLSRASRRWVGVAALIGGFVVAAAPHSVLTGQWMPNKSPRDLFRLFDDSVGSVAGPSLLLGFSAPAWQIPGRLVEEWARSGRYVIAMLFLAGLLLRSAPRAEATGRRLVATAALIHVGLLLARCAVYGEYSSRYVVIPAALSIPWSAAGWLTLLRLAGRLSAARTGQVVVLAAPVALMLLYVARPVYVGKEPLRAAGQWLATHAEPGERVVSRENLEQVMYYAGRAGAIDAWITFPHDAGVEQVTAIIAEQGPAWLVETCDSPRGAALRDGAIPGLRPSFSAGEASREVVIYRVAGRGR
jgi:hypothetical protein